MFKGRQWKRTTTALAVASVSTLTTVAAASDDVQPSLEEAVEVALRDWSEFATTGSLSAVATSFALDGPQFRQFEIEAISGESKPGADPLAMDIRDLRLRRLGSTTSTLWANIEVSRTGFVPEVVSWDFDLISEDGRWLVWTVVPVETPPTQPAMVETGPATKTPSPATTLAAASATQEPPVRVPNPVPVEVAPPGSLTGSSGGVRIPALSAWIIVITLVGVAAAGYMAPRIDRRQG